MAPRKYNNLDDDLVNHLRQLKQMRNSLKIAKNYLRMLAVRNSLLFPVHSNGYTRIPNDVLTREHRVTSNGIIRVSREVSTDTSSEKDITESISNININSPEIAVKEGSHDVNIDLSTMVIDEVNDTLQ